MLASPRSPASSPRRCGTASPRLVVVGLDFLDFRVDPSSDESFTPTPANADPIRELRERAASLLTLNALADSLATIKAQHEPYATSLTDAGFNPKRDYIGVARREGYFAMFRQRDQENALAYVRGPKSVFQAGGQTRRRDSTRSTTSSRSRAHAASRCASFSIRTTRILSCSSS